MKILLAVDGSAHSMAAVRLALQWALRGLRTRYVLVNVQEPPSLYEMAVMHDAQRLTQVRGDAGADLLAPAEAMLQGAGIEFETEVAGGADVANLLLELAENYGCDAIVIGAHGQRHEEAGGVGHTVAALLARSPLPVTVVRDSAG